MNRGAERGTAVPLDQPEAGRGEHDAGADDPVQLKIGEQEHRLDVVVVGSTAATQDEAEHGAEDEIQQRHHEPT